MKFAKLFGLFVWIAAILFTGFAAAPVFAATVAASSAPSALVDLQPLVSVLLQLAITALATIAIALLPKLALLRNNKLLSDNLTKLIWDAAHYAIASDSKVTGYVGSVYVGDPIIAAAANWLLTHAVDEIKGLNLSEAEVVSAVQAVIPQVSASLNTALKGKTA